MSRNPFWNDLNASTERGLEAWQYPDATVRFTPSASTLYENLGTTSGVYTTYEVIDFATAYLRSDATYNFVSTGTYKQSISIFDSAGYLLNFTDGSVPTGSNDLNMDSIISFKPDYSGTYYISNSNYYYNTGGIWALSVSEDIGSDFKNTTSTPTTLPATATSGDSVYRFYNSTIGAHFYTASANERDSLINNNKSYSYEGIAFKTANATSGDAISVYRFYNKKSSTHFFTTSISEKDNIISNLSGTYTYEGEAYKGLAANTSVSGSTPIYRFYNTKSDSHFFTASQAERDSVIKTLSGIYKYEGVAYNVMPASTTSARAADIAPQAVAGADWTAALQGSSAPEPDLTGAPLGIADNVPNADPVSASAGAYLGGARDVAACSDVSFFVGLSSLGDDRWLPMLGAA